ncbi:putative phosphopantothenoylcysteine decarboxylase [Dimargaris cristalligena]|nr:putative phosphopantothenoylcysteine decarboxylase [Dimargaris cristalligena]
MLQVHVKVISTQNSLRFYSPSQLNGAKLYTDEGEWQVWSKKGDPVVHIDLRKWADIMVVVPLDAHTLAKIANGLCDNLLTCVLRAWDFSKPCIVCPAMNTHMWDHPFTAKHLRVLTEELGIKVISPISKLLACGDTGVGAMAEPQDIITRVQSYMNDLIPSPSPKDQKLCN